MTALLMPSLGRLPARWPAYSAALLQRIRGDLRVLHQPARPAAPAVQDAEAARGLLRSGPFSGLRDNVRAVGQYAGQASSQEQGDTLVGGFFTNLQDFDFVLFTAVRSKAEVAPEAKEKLDATITALDR